MSKSNTFENSWLLLIFNAVGIAGLADDAAGGLSDLYVSLHTADPGEAGNQSTNEIAYDEYARVAVARDETGWVVTGNSVSPAEHVDFPEMLNGAGGTVTHFGVGTSASGAGTLLYSGATDPDPIIASGVTPRVKSTSTITED